MCLTLERGSAEGRAEEDRGEGGNEKAERAGKKKEEAYPQAD